jgi:hypothetical protein
MARTKKTTSPKPAEEQAKPKAKKAQRRKAPPKAPAAKPAAGKQPHGAKQAAVIELMSRPEGATTKELIEATGWQPHSVRGFIAASLRKKLGLKIQMKREGGRTVYWIS